MRKSYKTLAAAALAALLCLLPMTACSPFVDDENTLYIYVQKAGIGDKFAMDLGKRFEEISGKKVEVTSSALADSVLAKLKAGKNNTNIDLFFTIASSGNFNLLFMGKNALPGYDCIFEDLTDVYDSKAYNSERYVKDIIYRDMYEYFTIDGRQHLIPYSNTTSGLIYNADIFSRCGIETTPRTTDELVETCRMLKANNVHSFQYPGGLDYWKRVYWVWWAQYEGQENMDLFYEGKDYNGVYSADCYKQTGRLRAIEVLDTLLKSENDFTDPSANSYGFKEAQVQFLQGNGAMMPNGDWLENEMNANFKEDKLNIRFMKTPVVSALGDKLGITEDQLRDAVDYADAGMEGEKPAGISDDVLRAVYDARNVLQGDPAAQAYIPVYSNAKALAKEFLRFMYSEEGVSIVLRATSGIVLPVDYDFQQMDGYDALSGFAQSKFQYIEDAHRIYANFKSPMFALGGMSEFYAAGGCLESVLGTRAAGDYRTAESLYREDIDYYSARWTNMMNTAGVEND